MKKDKVILQVKKNYLISREQARALKRLILARGRGSQVILDFSQVKFISRSFADEFLNLLADLQSQNIKTRLAHLSPQIKPFLVAIRRRRNRIQREIL